MKNKRYFGQSEIENTLGQLQTVRPDARFVMYLKTEVTPSLPIPSRMHRLIYLPILALLTIFLLGGAGIVYAAGKSMPGELLYPVKRTLEDITIAVSQKPENKAMQHMKIAEERIKEIETLTEKHKEQKSIDELTKDYSSHLNLALTEAKKIEKENPHVLENVTAHIETQKQQLPSSHPQNDTVRSERSTVTEPPSENTTHPEKQKKPSNNDASDRGEGRNNESRKNK